MSDHIRGASVLVVAILMGVLGTPGLDMFHGNGLLPNTPARESQLAEPWGWWIVGFSDINRVVRDPFVKVLTPLQRPLRLAQSWSLYGSGPGKVRRFEVRVDGERVYRSGDDADRWGRSVFRYRKIRPIVAAYCHGTTKNRRGLVEYVVRRAREDFPDASEVVLSCTVTRWPGGGDERVNAVSRVAAPDWKVTE